MRPSSTTLLASGVQHLGMLRYLLRVAGETLGENGFSDHPWMPCAEVCMNDEIAWNGKRA